MQLTKNSTGTNHVDRFIIHRKSRYTKIQIPEMHDKDVGNYIELKVKQLIFLTYICGKKEDKWKVCENKEDTRIRNM